MYFADFLEAARRNLEYSTLGLVTSLNVAEECFATGVSSIKPKSLNVHQLTDPLDYARQPERSSLQKFQARIVSELQNS